MDDSQADPQPDIELETPASNIFIPPSINTPLLLSGASYTHFSPVPPSIVPPKPASDPENPSTKEEEAPLGPECCIGIDEAGRGPVLGPMVYGAFYLPISMERPLLATEHHFDDSKVLTPAFRSELMRTLCTPPSEQASKQSPDEDKADESTNAADEKDTPTTDPKSLYQNTGWAISLLSAQSISAHMLVPSSHAAYNLNSQAFDATVGLIQGILDRGVNVKEIYVDTVGPPATYQKRLELRFPGKRVTVAKKADSLYPVVSAASVVAKVTRDAGLEGMWEGVSGEKGGERVGEEEVNGEKRKRDEEEQDGWGSGYPSDVRTTSWMKREMDPVFGWGNECRFSWGTARDLLEEKGRGKVARAEWPVDEDEETSRLTDYFGKKDEVRETDELAVWFGTRVTEGVF